MSTVLVTGCAGFIGSHLTAALLDEGHRVHGIDCMTDYYSKELKAANLNRNLGQPGFVYHAYDLNDMALTTLIGMSGIEVVFHLAGQPGVRPSWGKEFDRYVSSNITAMQRLLEASVGVDRFVFASSSSVYGNAVEFPTRENMSLSPLSPYGATKVLGENMLRVYRDRVPSVALRYFTVFGPGQRPDMAFNRFIRAALLGEPITVYGTGDQSRDFTYVDDIVRGTIAAGFEPSLGPVYNLGGGNIATVNEALETISWLVDKKLDVRYEEVARGDVRDTDASTARARADLGFCPTVDLNEGLKRQVEWQRAQA